MPRILLYTDLSCRYGSTFTALAKQRPLLEQCGLHMPLPLYNAGVPSHNILWAFADKLKERVPSNVAAQMQEVTRLAEEGRDILLYDMAVHPALHQSILDWIRHMPSLKPYQIHMLFMLGRTACRLEQDIRNLEYWLGSMPPLSAMMDLARRRYLAADLLVMAREECGRDQVDVLVDSDVSCVDKGDPELLSRIFRRLGCPPQSMPPQSMPPRSILGLASQRNVHFANLLCVQGNQWPRIEDATVMECFQRQEAGASFESWLASPPAVRARALEYERDVLPRLAELAACSAEDLCMPPALYPRIPRSSCPTLTEREARDFVAVLPSDAAAALQRRLAQDICVLSSEERLLASIVLPDTPCRPQPLLTVLTLAYNHVKYIGEAIESVLAQRTDFPVEHIIVDHCSTDGTQDIITAYADKYASIRPVLLARRGRIGSNVHALFSRCRSQYVALCDGDDYFTDPLKLQKQVDFLEAHPDYAISFHPVRVIYEDDPYADGVFPPPALLPRGVRETYYLADLLRGNIIQTNSAVYRWRFRDGLPDWFKPDLVPGDYYWHLLHAETGKIGFLREIMSVYRRHKKSLYYSVLKSLVEHRRTHGMKELEMYDSVNAHFNGRYLRLLQDLANGVFTDFFNLYLKDHDNSFLDEACTRFPVFGKPFLQTVAHSLKKSSGTIKIARKST